MAKKVILKDDNVEIMPITRGELILDSSGQLAFHSSQFLATQSLPGLMSGEDKTKLDSLEKVTVEDKKVEQVNTTTNSSYRILFSNSADDTTKTEGARKSAKLLFNPSTGALTATALIGKLNWSNLNNVPENFTPAQHIHNTSEITALTSYSKATSASDLATTDTLNVALGKLEYKADTAYDWILSVTTADTDKYINKWQEILDFLNAVDNSEGADITDEFVTRKTGQTITGEKIFSGTSESLLTIDRNSTSPAWIKFAKNNTLLGYIGIDNSKKVAANIDGTVHYILHSGNSYIQNGVITINGATITPITSHQSLANYVTLNGKQTISGVKTFSTLLKFTVALGTAPFTVTSTTKVSNLNSDMVDGYHISTAGTTKPWSTIVTIGSDGVSEMGRYIDFHYDNTTGSDYSTRLQCGGNHSNTVTLPSATGTLALTSQIPSALKNPKKLTIFGVEYDGSTDKTVTAVTMISTLSEGSSNITDQTEILTSYASDNGFADTNAPNVVYKRDAVKLYNYINAKLAATYAGLNKTGTVTSVAISNGGGIGISGSPITSSGTIIISNAGVRSTTINGNYLRVNTNGTNTDLTIPYATQAKSLKHTTLTSGLDLNTLTTEGVYSNTQTNVCNSLVNGPTGRNNGECRLEVINCGSSSHSLQWLYTKAGKRGEIWYRMRTSDSTWSTWNKIAFTSNIPTSLKNPYTLTFSAGTFAAKTYDGSAAVTVNVPTKTSHLTNDSGYLTSRGYIGKTAVQASSASQSLTGITNATLSGKITFTTAAATASISFLNGELIDGYGNVLLGTNSASWNVFNSSRSSLITVLKSGNVGIGTTSPSYKLHVNGQAYSTGYVRSGSSDSYVLLGGGGHKALSDFAMASAYVKKAGDTMTGRLTMTGEGIIVTTATTSNYRTGVEFYKGTAADTTYSYDAQIGWHNTGGDGTGSICILPYATSTLPWGGNVGLFITKTDLKYNGASVWHAGNDGSGSGLDADLLDGTHKTGLLTALSSSSSTNLSITVGGTTKSITNTYATNITLISCYNGTTNNDLWSTVKTGNSTYIGTANIYEVYNDGGPTAYGEVLDIVSAHTNHWLALLWFGSGKAGHLYYRNKDYNDTTWGSWRTIIDTGNYSSYALPFYIKTTGDCNTMSQGLTVLTAVASNQNGGNHSAFLTITSIGTPFQLQIPDSSEAYIYKRYKSGSSWSGWSKLSAGYADSAGTSSNVVVNNSDANSTYRMVWHSGNTLYGTGGIYCNPSSDYLYANSVVTSDWFRSTGNTGWFSNTHGGGIYMADSTWVRIYNDKKFYVNNSSYDAIHSAGGVYVAGCVHAYANYLKSTCNGHTVTIGSMNSSWCHIETSAPLFYFNKDVQVDGHLYEYSDIRKKNIIQKLEDIDFSEASVVQFKWKHDPKEVHVGVIALEIEELLPEVVNTDCDGYKSVDYGVLGTVSGVIAIKKISKLLEKVKELEKEIEILKKKN